MEFYQMHAESLPSIHFVDDAVIRSTWLHRKRKPLEYIMYVIRHGEMFLEEDGVPLTLGTGDICILDKDRTHVGVKPAQCSYYYVHFLHDDFRLVDFRNEREALELLAKYRESSLSSDIFSYDKCGGNRIFLPKHCHIYSQAVRLRVEELLQKARQETYKPVENYKVMCACYIQQAFMEISRCYLDEAEQIWQPSFPVYYETVRKITEWLNQNYAREVTSNLLESVFEYNFDYMNRIFKKINGETVFQYLTRIRIGHAKLLLQNTSMKVGEIGKRVGFPDEYYFNRVFKKYVGVSPGSYARDGQVFGKEGVT